MERAVQTVREVIQRDGVRCVYQPIVDLDTLDLVAVEALARGPIGSSLESPAALCAAAASEGLTTELDWTCRAVAVRGALRAELPTWCRLFINAEPSSFSVAAPHELRELFERAARQLSIVIEVTERAIATDPASLLATLRRARALGFGVAIEGASGYRTTTKRLLMPMCDHMEHLALQDAGQSVPLSAFQHVSHFTPATARRYAALAANCALVGALGVGMPSEPVTGVRGAHIDDRLLLVGEWTVTVVGPHHAAALIAQDRGDVGPDGDRRFDYVITHDRDLVIAAARSLMQHIEPVSDAVPLGLVHATAA